MNKIVSEHIPASEVPANLRPGIDEDSLVTVTVQEEPSAINAPSESDLRRLLDLARLSAKGVTAEEAVARIRSLRDEWDD